MGFHRDQEDEGKQNRREPRFQKNPEQAARKLKERHRSAWLKEARRERRGSESN